MRKITPLDVLFPRTRQGILAATLMHPDRWWYLSDLANHLGVRPSSLQRDLASLTAVGILRRRRDGNRVYVQPNTDCPFFLELRGLLTKTAGLADVLREALQPLAGRVVFAFVYGSLARTDARPDSDVDLMVIGEVGLAALTPLLRKAEKRLARPVNPTVYTGAELAKKLKARHHFLHEVLASPKIFIIGRADELDRLTRRPARAATHGKPTGA